MPSPGTSFSTGTLSAAVTGSINCRSQLDIAAGIAVRRGRLKASLAYVYQTKRFKGQELKPLLGSLNIAVFF